MWKDGSSKSGVLLDKLVALVTMEILGNQKKLFWILHKLILKVIRFQVPTPKRFSTVVKKLFFLKGGTCPMSIGLIVESKLYRVSKWQINIQNFILIGQLFSLSKVH